MFLEGWKCGSLAEHLPSMFNVLSLIPSTAKRKVHRNIHNEEQYKGSGEMAQQLTFVTLGEDPHVQFPAPIW